MYSVVSEIVIMDPPSNSAPISPHLIMDKEWPTQQWLKGPRPTLPRPFLPHLKVSMTTSQNWFPPLEIIQAFRTQIPPWRSYSNGLCQAIARLTWWVVILIFNAYYDRLFFKYWNSQLSHCIPTENSYETSLSSLILGKYYRITSTNPN